MIRKLPLRLMLRLKLMLLLALTLSACSPKYDWRDYRSQEAPYSVLFPGKPAKQTRTVKLGQLEVSMSMAAADIDGVIFAVGSATLADAAQAPAAVAAMRTAMVNNIGGTLASDTQLDHGARQVDASGKNMRLIGRFLSSDRRVYQVVVIGAPQKIDAETVETFLGSFRLL